METYRFFDEDFGDVKMEYCPETKNLVMDSLVIRNTPSDFDNEMIVFAWDSFKRHYNSYGFVVINYEDIPNMENILSR